MIEMLIKPRVAPDRSSCAVLFVALLASAGCSRASPFRSMERSIRAELPRLIGPADGYEVAVSRSAAGLIAGRIPWIEIHGHHVRAVQGLNLDVLAVRLEGVRFNRTDHTVREIEQSRFEAGIRAGSITQFIHARRPALRDVRVTITRGEIHVRVTPSLLGLGVPIEVDGRPVLHGATAIDFEISRVSLLRLGLPEFGVRRLEERVNPIVDLSTLPFPVRLSAARIEGEQVVVDGTPTLAPSQLKE
jgi:DUF2993 family protein